MRTAERTPDVPFAAESGPRRPAQGRRGLRAADRAGDAGVKTQLDVGHPLRRIARDLGLARNTVRRYLRTGRCPDRATGRPRPVRLDAHRGWVDRRIGEGCTNAAQLHRELLARGVRASPMTVRRFVTKRLAAMGRVRSRVNAARSATVVPTPRQLSFAWVRRPERRPADEQARIDAVRGVGGEVAAGLDLADGFAELVRKRPAITLEDWLAGAEGSGCAEVRAFAAGIRRDEAAVRAAVTTAWSNGQVEGQVGRLKLVKRSGYGRAGFELLRARVLNPV